MLETSNIIRLQDDFMGGVAFRQEEAVFLQPSILASELLYRHFPSLEEEATVEAFRTIRLQCELENLIQGIVVFILEKL